MSVKIMTLVWDMDLPHTEKLVMLALADNANDKGVCWPSISTLATKCCMDRATVIRRLHDLEIRGLIVRSSESGKTNSYQLHPSQPATSRNLQPVAGSDHTSRSVQPVPVAACDPTRRSVRPRTIIEPSSEPSENHHSRSAREVPRQTFDGWAYIEQHIKPTYPRGIYAEAQWLIASKHVERIIADGLDTPEGLASKVSAYRAQCDALERTGTQFVMNPAKHFDPGGGAWRGPFPLPTKPETPMERIHRLNSPSRVLDGEVANG